MDRELPWGLLALAAIALAPVAEAAQASFGGADCDCDGGAVASASFAGTAKATAGSVLGAAVVAAVFFVSKYGPLALFTRILPERLAHHPVRRGILAAVGKSPGIHGRALARSLGLSNGALEHHAGKLLVAGHIVAEASNGHTCYFLPTVNAALRQSLLAARSDASRRVVGILAQEPGLTVEQVASRVGLRASSLQYHLGRLGAADLVQRQRNGRNVHLHLTATGVQVAKVMA